MSNLQEEITIKRVKCPACSVWSNAAEWRKIPLTEYQRLLNLTIVSYECPRCWTQSESEQILYWMKNGSH